MRRKTARTRKTRNAAGAAQAWAGAARAAALAIAALAWCGPAAAQGVASALPANSPLLGSVPDATVLPESLPLSLGDAIQRGLAHNLGAVSARDAVDEAHGARLQSLAKLLPQVSGRIAQSNEQINLASFGFPGLPGIAPIVGPFNVFDARVYLSQPIFDLQALGGAREDRAKLDAARYGVEDARDLVVLVCANLYLRTVASESRVEAVRAELATAEALQGLAADRKQAGLVAGIEVLRARVQVETRRQQLIAAENDREKSKLQLARAIGLPLAQVFTLTDQVPYTPLEPMPLDAALALAYQSRADYKQQASLVQAAEARRQSVLGERLPSVSFDADYGTTGHALNDSHGTFSVAASVHVPLFEGGAAKGRAIEADAGLRQQQAQLADLKGRIEYQVRSALLDLRAVDQQLQAARTQKTLADAQLAQATDRFKAGVADNLEVVQAQEAVAGATEGYIATLYGFNVAKATLARALGVAAERAQTLLGETSK